MGEKRQYHKGDFWGEGLNNVSALVRSSYRPTHPDNVHLELGSEISVELC
jgi:hypothetical protein